MSPPVDPALPWVPAGDAALLQTHGRCLVALAGRQVVVWQQGDALFALDDSCPHSGASLCSGKLEAGHVRCPAHGLRFRLSDGRLAGSPADGPASPMAVAVFPVRVVDGVIELQDVAGR